MTAIVKEELLDERLAQLETARSWSPRLVSKLESHIRSADDEALFRINPFTFARERSLKENEVIDLLLHATSLGLFGMDWLLLCPKCSCVVESLRSLEGVHRHYHCTCLPGRPRSVARRPDRHHLHGQPANSRHRISPSRAALRPRLLLQIRRDARRRPARRQALRRRQDRADKGRELSAARRDDADGHRRQRRVYSRHKPRRQGEPVVLRRGSALSDRPGRACSLREAGAEHAPGSVAPGPITFEVKNATAERGTFFSRCCHRAPRSARHRSGSCPFLTGKRLLTTQTFRDLFRSEVIRASEGIGVKDITLAVHRHQGFDGSLRSHRRSQCLCARAAAFRASAGHYRPLQWRDHQDHRRCRDGGIPEPVGRRGCRAGHARATSPAFNAASRIAS